MCVPSFSPFINLSPDPPLPDLFSLPFKITLFFFPAHMRACVCVFLHRLIALDATCRRWTILTLLPQVPIAANVSDEAEIMWNFPNEKKQKKKFNRFKASWILSEMISLFGNGLMNSSVPCPRKRNCCRPPPPPKKTLKH